MPILQLCLGLTLAAKAAPLQVLEAANVEPLVTLASNHDLWLETPFLSAPPASESYTPFEPRSLEQLKSALELRELEQILMTPEARTSHHDRGYAMVLYRILLHRETAGRLTLKPRRLLAKIRGTPFNGRRSVYRAALLEWGTLPRYQRAHLARDAWTAAQWRELSLLERRGILLDVLWRELAPVASYDSADYAEQRLNALSSMHDLLTRAEFDQGLAELEAANQIRDRIQAIRKALTPSDESDARGARLNALINSRNEAAIKQGVDQLFDEMGLAGTALAPPLHSLPARQRAELLDEMAAAVQKRLEGHPLSPHVAALMAHSGFAPITVVPGPAAHYAWSGWDNGSGYQSRVRLNLDETKLAQTLVDLGHSPYETLDIRQAAEDLADVYTLLFIEAGTAYRQHAWARTRAQELGAVLNGELDNLAARWILMAERELYWRSNLRAQALVTRLLRAQNGLGLMISPHGPPSFSYFQLILSSLEGAVARSLPPDLDSVGVATIRFLSEYVLWIRTEVARLDELVKTTNRRQRPPLPAAK